MKPKIEMRRYVAGDRWPPVVEEVNKAVEIVEDLLNRFLNVVEKLERENISKNESEKK